MILNSELQKIRTLVDHIRKNTQKVLKNNNDELTSVVRFIDNTYLQNEVEELFPTNVSSGNVASHSHPLKGDLAEGSVTVDHGFKLNSIKIDTAFTTCFSSFQEKEYYQVIKKKYRAFIEKIRDEIKIKKKVTNYDIAVLFDYVFDQNKGDFCKTLLGHRIGESLHEEPYLQMGLLNSKLLIDEKVLEDGFYAIEIYFVENLREDKIHENKDLERAIYKLGSTYTSFLKLGENRNITEVYYPLVSKINQRINQIEETFILEGTQLVCLSCDL